MIQSQYTPDVYTGNGAVTTYAFSWRILAKSDLIAIKLTSLGVVSTLVLDTDYTIADSQVNTANGGNIVLTTALPNNDKLFLLRSTAKTQLVDLVEAGTFPAETVEKEFDRLTMFVQDLAEEMTRALKFAKHSTLQDKDFPDFGAADGNKVVKVKSDGSALEVGAVTNVADISGLTFTPSVLADWNGSADPGDSDDALNQLAERTKDLETQFHDLFDWQFVRKTADESVTSSTTLQADDHLTFAVLANQIWEFEFVIFHVGNETGDIKVSVSGPAATAGYWSSSGHIAGSVAGTRDYDNRAISTWDQSENIALGNISTLVARQVIKGLAVIGANAGNVTLNWAQNTSNGTALTLKANSYVIARRVL